MPLKLRGAAASSSASSFTSYPRTGFFGYPIGNIGTFSISNGRMYCVPLDLAVSATVDQIIVKVSTAGTTTTSVMRVGMYTDNAGYPGSLIIDSGVSPGGATGLFLTDTTGTKTVALSSSITLPAGRTWLAAVGQGAPAANPVMISTSFSGIVSGGDPGAAYSSYFQDSVTGALPSTFTLVSNGFVGSGIRTGVRFV